MGAQELQRGWQVRVCCVYLCVIAQNQMNAFCVLCILCVEMSLQPLLNNMLCPVSCVCTEFGLTADNMLSNDTVRAEEWVGELHDLQLAIKKLGE